MKPTLLFLSLTLLLTHMNAQNIQGTFALPTQNGEIVLVLQLVGQNQIQGTMTTDQGMVYQVRGSQEAGDAMGTIQDTQGNGMYFTAFEEENELYLALMPPDAQGQPNYDQATEYVMPRRGAAVGSNQTGGGFPQTQQPRNPLGNQGGFGGPAAGSSWAGTYSGNINGTPATCTLQEQGGQLSGLIDAGGYKYQLQGTAQGSSSQGQVFDPQTQGQMTYQGSLNGATLNLTLIASNGFGQQQQIPLQFHKGGAATQSGGLGQQGYTQGGMQGGGNDKYERDTRLVGAWSRSSSYNSGEYGFTSQESMQVLANGTYLIGEGRVVGGGPGIGGDTGTGGGVQGQGQWRTQNGVIYISEGHGWVPFAGYYVEGYKLMLKFNDGTNQVWHRQ